MRVARRESIAMSATVSLSDVRVTKPPAVGGLLSLVTRELFRFEALGLGTPGKACVTIGASAECHIVLDDPCVSSVHAAVAWDAGTCRIVDLMSRNGVFQVVGRRAQKIKCVELALGQRLVLGRTTLVCVTEAGHAPLTAFDVDELASLAFHIVADRQPARSPLQRIKHDLRRAWGRNRPT
jgi:hypothetical protein